MVTVQKIPPLTCPNCGSNKVFKIKGGSTCCEECKKKTTVHGNVSENADPYEEDNVVRKIQEKQANRDAKDELLGR